MELITSLLLVNIYTGRNFIQEQPFLFLRSLLFTFVSFSALHAPLCASISCFYSIAFLPTPTCSITHFIFLQLSSHVSFCVFISASLCVCLGGVVDNLQTAGFFNDKVTKSCLFTTVHDAVLYCQSAITQSQSMEYKVWALKHTHHGTWWRMSKCTLMLYKVMKNAKNKSFALKPPKQETFFDIYFLQVIKLHSIVAFSNTQPLI